MAHGRPAAGPRVVLLGFDISRQLQGVLAVVAVLVYMVGFTTAVLDRGGGVGRDVRDHGSEGEEQSVRAVYFYQLGHQLGDRAPDPACD